VAHLDSATGRKTRRTKPLGCGAFHAPQRFCGLWHTASPRVPPTVDACGHDPDGDPHGQTEPADEPREWVYVDIDTFEATY